MSNLFSVGWGWRPGLRSVVMLGILIASFVCVASAQATTYYIDYQSGSDANNGIAKNSPWKRAPGMSGFAGTYTHQAGDTFVFKGGVTWPATTLPLTVSYSGNSTYRDIYTTDHSWFVGGSWSQPVFDAQQTAASSIVVSSRSYFTINDLKIINVSGAQTANSKKSITISDSSHFTVSNLTIAPECWIGLYIYTAVGGQVGDITITGNDVSKTAMGIVVATAAAGSVIDSVDIGNNTVHDFTSQIGAGTHGDGIHIWGSGTDNSQYLQNLKIHDNVFYGDFHRSFGATGGMTGLIFIENATEEALIYNNAGSYIDNGTSQFQAMIAISGNAGRGGHHIIYNNSFQGTTPGMSAGITIGAGQYAVPYTTVRNNILSGMQYAYSVDSGSETGTTFDYNLLNVSATPLLYLGSTRTWAAWQGLGFETHGINGLDPQFVSGTDLRLQSGSPARDTGTSTLAGTFINDILGTARPQGLAWDIGAYEFLTGVPGDTTAPIITAFTLPTTASSLNVAISSFVATDAVGVTGYLLTESATTPDAGAVGWSASAPTSYIFSSAGTKTLYAWTKDAAGNVSTSLNQSVTITLPTTPTVTIQSATAISINSATLNASITADGGASSTFRGFEYGLSTSYGTLTSETGTYATGNFNKAVSGLTCATTYHYRAFARNSAGTSSSTDQSFTTQSCSGDTTPPTVSLTAPAADSTFTLGATVPLAASASDAVGLVRVDFYIEQSLLGSASNIPYTVNWVPSGTGSFVLSAVAYDAGGNWATSTVTIRVVAPTPIETRSSGGGGGGGGGGRTVTRPTTSPSHVNPYSATTTPLITQNLFVGLNHLEVRLLQQFLNTHGFPVSLTGPGSSGQEKTMFGPATRAAVIRFQKAFGISPVGIVGPATRAKITGLAQTPIVSTRESLLKQIQTLQAKLNALLQLQNEKNKH